MSSCPHARDLLFYPGRHIGGLLQATDQHPATEPAAFLRRMIAFDRCLALLSDDEPAIGLPLLHPVCQHFAFLYYMRIHYQRYPQKINVYDTFIEGAKEGFQTAVTIIPYLIAVLVAIAVFRAFGSDGFPDRRHPHGSLGSRAGHAVRGRSAYHADETAQRQRGAGYDAGMR